MKIIHIFVTRYGSHTFKEYLQDWAGYLKGQLVLHLYEELTSWEISDNGVFIFSDLERLDRQQLTAVSDYANEKIYHSSDNFVLNNPELSLTRIPLLQMLHKNGINNFNVYNIRRIPKNIRFPVFLRYASDHSGPRTSLLSNYLQIYLAFIFIGIVGKIIKGRPINDLIIVEYLDTSDHLGFFRKYSAFRFGDLIIPAHIIFSANWVAKDGAPLTKEMAEEERQYLNDNPHQTELMSIFNQANIQYGRIDYSLLEGKIQVWEINTNPTLLKPKERYLNQKPEVLLKKERLASKIQSSLGKLNIE